jgi:3-oxoadipate enol-lactonase
VLAVIRELGLAPLHLAGLSMGGFAGLRIAARHPGLLKSLTLLNTSASAHTPGKVLSHLVLTAVGRVAGVSLPLVVSRVEAEMYGAPFLSDPANDAQRQQWRQRWAQADRAALAKTMLGIAFRPGVRDELADIKIPVLIIAGGADVSLPPAQSRLIHSLIPRSRLVDLPGVGHSSPVEDPAGVTKALSEFLATAGGGSP